MRVRARSGCQLGTKCPAPLTVTNVTPLYCTTYPPTCDYQKLVTFKNHKKVLIDLGENSIILIRLMPQLEFDQGFKL